MIDGEVIEYEGKHYRRRCARTIDRFVVGVDLGKQNDFTAICVLHHSTRALESWTSTLPRGGAWQIGRLEQDTETFFDVLALERIPLGTAYPQQVQRAEQIMGKPRLSGADLIIDSGGVGNAVADLFAHGTDLKPIRIIITGGIKTAPAGRDEWHVPKIDIVSAIDARIGNELRFAPGLALEQPFREELQSFNRRRSEASGHEMFNARSGQHDDLVLAVGLAMWWATAEKARRRGRMTAQHVKGLI